MNFSIFLTNFRSHNSASFDFKVGINFICAPNGWGKTNLLEAISLLSPGRGLRKANSADMVNKDSVFFSISARFESYSLKGDKQHQENHEAERDVNINDSNLITISYLENKKKFSWNGANISAIELIEEIGIFWLTPQIIFNFWREPKVRRDFFDRIVANFIPTHLYNCAKYEKVRLNRNKLIKSGYANQLAYDAMEKVIVEEGMRMVENRQKVMDILNEKIDVKTSFSDLASNNKIKSKYRIRGVGLSENTSGDLLKKAWKRDLEESRIIGRERFGAHKTNIVIEEIRVGEVELRNAGDFTEKEENEFIVEIKNKIQYIKDELASEKEEKDRKSKNLGKKLSQNLSDSVILTSETASTGQQHLMIISLLMSAFKNLQQKTKILLLDDVLSHLDQKNKLFVMDFLQNSFQDDYILIADTEIPEVGFQFNRVIL